MHAGGLNLYEYAGNSPTTMTDHTGLEPRVLPAPSGTAWTGERHAVFDGGTSESGYGMDPSSYSIKHGPRPPTAGSGAMSDGPTEVPFMYSERNLRNLSEILNTDESTIYRGMLLLGAVSYGFGRGRGSCSSVRINKFRYAPRVRARGVEDPSSHNFPYSFDAQILSTKPIPKRNGYLIFQHRGSMTGRVVRDPQTGIRTQKYLEGVFEIGVTKDGIIDHRFFRPDS